MCEQCRCAREQDRILWATIRRALLMIAAGIEKRYADREEPKQVRRAA